MEGELSLVFDGRSEDLNGEAEQFQEKPHAVVDPLWTEASLAVGPWAARRLNRYPEIERMLDAYPKISTAIEAMASEYGMWIYGNAHNSWDPRTNEAGLHRVWQNSHYQNVGLGWLLYLRSGSRVMLERARAQTDNFMDVGTVNYVNADDPPLFHLPGAMHHVKAFVPWGATTRGMKVRDADAGVLGHYVDPDAFLLRYLIEGDLRARDLYRMWASSLGERRLGTAAGREAVNTFAMTLNYYEATWDPQAILYNHDFAEAALKRPLEAYKIPAWFPVWHPSWMQRYDDLTRDPRIVERVESYLHAGFGRPAVDAMLFRHTKDAKLLTKRMNQVYESARKVYYNGDDPLDGYGPYAHAVQTRWLAELPIYLAGLRSAGVDAIRDPGAKSSYPAASAHLSKPERRSEVAVRVLALEPGDRGFTVRLGGERRGKVQAFVIAPSGKIVQTLETEGEIISKAVARDGERGVDRIEIQGYRPEIGMPLTDLPAEVASLPKGQPLWTGRRLQGVLALPPGSRVTVSFTVDRKLPRAGPGYVSLSDRAGGSVLDTTLLAGSRRDSTSVTLESGKTIGVWPIHIISNEEVQLSWSGQSEAVYFGLKARDVETILHALK